MLVDRVSKETTDITRFEESLLQWLDPGETITEIVSQTVSLGTTGWSAAPYPPPGAPPPYDPTPLLLLSSTMDLSNTSLIGFVEFGTPGNVYTCQFVLQGSSARRITVEVGVQVKGQPPQQPLPVPVLPPPQGALALSITGGTMQGPLYLYEDPTYPTEAATKHYVDTQSYDQVPLQTEIEERKAADLTEATTRAAADTQLAHEMLVFRFPPGTVAADAAITWPLAYAVVVPYLLAGAVSYAAAAPTADAVFTLNQIRGNTTTAIGTLTLHAGSRACTPAGQGGSMAVGDVLQLVAPATPDATLTDLAISLLVSISLP